MVRAMKHAIFTQVSHKIKITAMPVYLEEQSLPQKGHYVWAYTIRIENQRSDAVQLMNRYWHITDAEGQVQEVYGEGVIGEQPVLKPGEVFQYTSGAVLPMASGFMRGSYEMKRIDDIDPETAMLVVDIPAFSLDSPLQTSRPN